MPKMVPSWHFGWSKFTCFEKKNAKSKVASWSARSSLKRTSHPVPFSATMGVPDQVLVMPGKHSETHIHMMQNLETTYDS